MRNIKNIFAATLLLLSAAGASANCSQRPAKGMFAKTVAPSSVTIKVAKPVVSMAK